VNIDREIDSQIVNWTKWVASSRRGAIHDSIGVAGQNRTAWNPSTVVNKATHSSSRRFNAKVLVSAIGARNCGILYCRPPGRFKFDDTSPRVSIKWLFRVGR
jgi:hypothetical protein